MVNNPESGETKVWKNKILFLANYGADYGEYLMLHGLGELTGGTRVVVYPFKQTLVGGIDIYPERYIANDSGSTHYLGPKGCWGELWTDKSLYKIWKCDERTAHIPKAHDGPPGFYQPIPRLYEYSFEYIIEGLRSGEFPFIILGSPRWFNSIALSEIREILGSKCPPVVMICSEDYYQIRYDFVNAFHIEHYFKRTFFNGYTDVNNPRIQHKVNFYPLPLSSIYHYEWVPWDEREYDVFCVFGATQVLRPKIIEIVKEVCSNYPELKTMICLGHPFPHDEYMRNIRHSRIVVDHQRLGTDTLRTFETLSTGAAMVGDICINMPDPYIDGTHFFQYENDMSPEGDKQKLDIFRSTLLRAIHGLKDGTTERIARNGYDHTHSKHKSINRAKYLLQTLKDNGVNIGDLL